MPPTKPQAAQASYISAQMQSAEQIVGITGEEIGYPARISF